MHGLAYQLSYACTDLCSRYARSFLILASTKYKYNRAVRHARATGIYWLSKSQLNYAAVKTVLKGPEPWLTAIRKGNWHIDHKLARIALLIYYKSNVNIYMKIFIVYMLT